MTVVAAPVFEEWLFRGVIMQTLKRYGRWFALVITSLLFALCHGSLSSAISVFFIGMAIGYVVMQTDSLINGILMHMANNAVALLSLYADNQIMTVLLSLMIIATGICGIVLFILALRNRSKLIRPLISPYDYPIKAYFKNWVAILTLVILGLMMPEFFPIICAKHLNFQSVTKSTAPTAVFFFLFYDKMKDGDNDERTVSLSHAAA